ncbi:EF-hand domain-containing protein, partial [Streptomyces virginiae]|uniref:EF-hand domain-containing protein n=1 Tax=Streptomyces virginiae TaxID=1961 RepID=UPI0036778C23
MATDPQYAKLFDATDTNHDGTLEWADFQRLVDRFVKVYNLGPHPHDHRTLGLRAAYQVFWADLVRHANADRLSKEQFVQALRAVASDTSVFSFIEDLPNALFDIADTNGDSALDKDEFVRLIKAAGITADPSALDTFTRLDNDGDGVTTAGAHSKLHPVPLEPRRQQRRRRCRPRRPVGQGTPRTGAGRHHPG